MLKKTRQRRSRIVQTLNESQGYVSGLRSLRSCLTVFLSILRECCAFIPDVQIIDVLLCRNCFSVDCEEPL
jgi:hypothetical protein